MITVSKGILHVMLACKWRYTLLTRPHMSKKWGGGPIDCECGGRIVEVRSTKQSVIKVLTPKSIYDDKVNCKRRKGIMEKAIKLVALDLDGTLFRPDKSISSENKEAITEAVQDGVQVVVSTGRPYCGLPLKELEEMGVCYAITANGAGIYRVSQKECLYSDCMDNQLSVELVERLDQMDIHMDLFAEGDSYSDEKLYDKIDLLPIPKPMQAYIQSSRSFVKNLPQYVRDRKIQIQKITMNFYQGEDGIYTDYEKVLRMLSADERLEVVSGGYHNLEITKKGTTKGKGLHILADLLNIPMEQTMACGDTQNDMDILQAAAIGVAMGNATEEVKQNADFVTLSNEEDGVAYAIRKLLFGVPVKK